MADIITAPTSTPQAPINADTLRNQAYEATNQVGTLATSVPTLLNELKQNLVGIFSKNNPLIDERNKALEGYMSTAAQSRADVLPSNMPTVEGRPLALSPTQQNALTTSRLAASFAPLAGYNEILKGMFGNIGDMVAGAGNLYETQVGASQQRAANLMDLYKTAVQEEEARRSGSGLGLDLASIIALLRGEQGTDVGQVTDPETIANDIYGVSAEAAPPAPQVDPGGVPLNWQQQLINALLPGTVATRNPVIANMPRSVPMIPTGPSLPSSAMFGFDLGGSQTGSALLRR